MLTEQDFRPVLEGMKLHLMKTNVAMEIAHKICEGVGGSCREESQRFPKFVLF